MFYCIEIKIQYVVILISSEKYFANERQYNKKLFISSLISQFNADLLGIQKLNQFAEEELKAALESTNTFFNDEWKSYRTSIESLDLSPFKETESFELK